MSKQDVIANQIIEIIKGHNYPAYKIYFKEAGDVVIDFSKDISFMFFEFLDTENRSRNSIATLRLLKRIKKGISNEDISKVLDFIFNDLFNRWGKSKSNLWL